MILDLLLAVFPGVGIGMGIIVLVTIIDTVDFCRNR
jgi:hypothetical protein